MADPEIQLPMSPSQLRLSNSAPGISNSSSAPEEASPLDSHDPTSRTTSTIFEEKFIDKSDQEEPSEDEHQGSAEIVHLYLTFSTELPHPTSIHPSRDGQNAPPEPPELKGFECPFDWPERRKNMIIWVACVITALTAFTAGAYSPGIDQMTDEWHVSNVAALVGITMFTTGRQLCFSPWTTMWIVSNRQQASE
jgi:hypothetical protein